MEKELNSANNTDNAIKVTDFFNKEYVNYASYDLVRKLASYIDGQKNASRKVLHTVIQQNINSFVKVSNLAPKVQEYTEYLHGSLEGIVVNMAKDYIGSNNIPLLKGDGNFGTRFIPDAAAARYIFAKKADIVDKLFHKDDYASLPAQEFEGSKIEPRYYVPVLPIIAINGADGVSVGFAQKILPRNPKDIIEWIKSKAKNKAFSKTLTPYWNGSECKIEKGDADSQWKVYGNIHRESRGTLVINSLPIGITLKGYQKILDRLEETNVIKSYIDKSDNDNFLFVVKADTSFCDKDEEELLKIFKLVKTITENYTCIGENNDIIQFKNFEDLLESWYDIRITHNKKRKEHVLNALNEKLLEASVKKEFITGVINNKIEVYNKTDEEIQKSIESHFKGLKLGEIDINNYNLINIPLRMLTKKEITKLEDSIEKIKNEIEYYNSLSYEDILLNDLKALKELNNF